MAKIIDTVVRFARWNYVDDDDNRLESHEIAIAATAPKTSEPAKT
jgi:hypothetical protein